jgi:hypothetical protein
MTTVKLLVLQIPLLERTISPHPKKKSKFVSLNLKYGNFTKTELQVV